MPIRIGRNLGIGDIGRPMLIPGRRHHRHIDGDQARRRAQMSMTPVTRSWSNARLSANIYDFCRNRGPTEASSARVRAPSATAAGPKPNRDARNVMRPSTIIVTVQDAFRERSLHQHRADHVSRFDVSIVGPRIGGSSLRRAHAELRRELLRIAGSLRVEA